MNKNALEKHTEMYKHPMKIYQPLAEHINHALENRIHKAIV